MPRSMTTFARFEHVTEDFNIIMEVRSLNSRFCDIALRTPAVFSQIDERIKKKIKKEFIRGRIELTAHITGPAAQAPVFEPDIELARSYLDAAKKLSRALKIDADIKLNDLLLLLKDAVTVVQEEKDMEELWPPVEKCLDSLFVKAIAMAEQEGSALVDDLLSRLSIITSLVDQVEEKSCARLEEAKSLLRERAENIMQEVPVDEARLAQEIMYLSDRLDIHEELVRIRSHAQQFKNYLNEDGAVGRRLDFLIQEMFREANTISSKSSDAFIAHKIVEIKSELEKMREQVQNIV